MNDPARVPLRPLERWGIALLLLVLVLLGIVMEKRTAFWDERRMGDFGCFVRGAWAVWSGAGLYDVVDNGWHYNYPPFFAILLVPMADPPVAEGPAPYLPFAVSVGLWYLLSLAFLVHAIHVLASALEQNSRDPGLRVQPHRCRRWWALRLLPLIVCAIPVGHTLMRGQVNTLILALLCSMIAAFLRKQDFRAGLWLALATSIKVIPVYLVIYPLARRNWRALAGWFLGLEITLIVIPFLVWGPGKTIDIYQDYAKKLIGPALGISDDTSRKYELGYGLTDNQSLKVAAHHLMYPHFNHRLRTPAWTAWSYRIGGVLLTAITLAVGFRSGSRSDWSHAAVLGCLIFLMCVLSPVCHLHYFTCMLPLIMALLCQRWEFRKDISLGPRLCCLMSLMFVANLLPHFPSQDLLLRDLGLPHFPSQDLLLRDLGLPLYAGLCIWVFALWRVWHASVPCEHGGRLTRWAGGFFKGRAKSSVAGS